jgi:hypothetical protein
VQNADADRIRTRTSIFEVLLCQPMAPPLPLQGTETSVRRRFLGSTGASHYLPIQGAPEAGALPNFNRSGPQAATLVGLTSRRLLELAIGITRDFMASGISRTRSTCRSPFSRLAPLTLT